MLPSVARATLRGPRQLTQTVGCNGLVGQLEKIPVQSPAFFSTAACLDGVPGAIICPEKAYVHSVTFKRKPFVALRIGKRRVLLLVVYGDV